VFNDFVVFRDALYLISNYRMRVNILRKKVRKWAYENIVGKKVYNQGKLFYDHTLLDIKKKAENV